MPSHAKAFVLSLLLSITSTLDCALSSLALACQTRNTLQEWTLDVLQQYVFWVKDVFHPDMSVEAEQILTGYYQLQRNAIARTAARTTVRMLESLVRIAQAHAKLMARDVVTEQDAVIAVSIAEAASQVLSRGLSFNAGADYSDNPDAAYLDESQDLLQAVRHVHTDGQ